MIRSRQRALRSLTEAITRIVDRGESLPEISLDRLAREAGIARSTLYAHFADRSSLMQAIATDLLHDLLSASAPILALRAPVSPADLRSAMRKAVHAFAEREAIVQVIVGAAAQDPAVEHAYRQGVELVMAAAEHLITTQGNAENPRQTARLIVLMVERSTVWERPGRNPDTANPLADTLADIVWPATFAERTGK